MHLKRCDNGHFYDDQKHKVCSLCGGITKMDELISY